LQVREPFVEVPFLLRRLRLDLGEFRGDLGLNSGEVRGDGAEACGHTVSHDLVLVEALVNAGDHVEDGLELGGTGRWRRCTITGSGGATAHQGFVGPGLIRQCFVHTSALCTQCCNKWGLRSALVQMSFQFPVSDALGVRADM
jgi:hypothetical protein